MLLKTENNKKNNFRLLFTLTKYCSFALMHCSCPMNSARGTSQKKKVQNEKCKTWTLNPNIYKAKNVPVFCSTKRNLLYQKYYVFQKCMVIFY